LTYSVDLTNVEFKIVFGEKDHMDENLNVAPSSDRRKFTFLLILVPAAVILFILALFLQNKNKLSPTQTLDTLDEESVFGNVKEKEPKIADYDYFTSYTKDKDGKELLSAITSKVVDIQDKFISVERKNNSPLVVDTSVNVTFYKYRNDLNGPLELADFSEIKEGMTVTVFLDYNSNNSKIVFRLVE